MNRIFYHSGDLDGFCSGAVAKHYLLSTGVPAEQIQFYPFNYDDKFPYDQVDSIDQLIFVDVSVQPYSEMIEICKNHNTILIDHHKTMIDALGDFKPNGIQVSGKKAACELAWNFFFPTKDVPIFVKLLSDYDVWNNENKEYWNERVMPFQYGMKIMDIRPYLNWGFWDALFLLNEGNMKNFVVQTIHDGEIILNYQDQTNRKILGCNAFEASFENLRALCCNTSFKNSQFFHTVWDEQKHDLMLAFDIDKIGKYNVSLYTTKDAIDVSTLALKYGGGGHKKAAGFSARQILINGKEILIS